MIKIPKITFPIIPRRIILSVSLMLCLLFIIIYFIVYVGEDRERAAADRVRIENNRIRSEKNNVLLLENKKLLLENQTMLGIDSDIPEDSIYNMIRINDSIIYVHMLEIEKNAEDSIK